MFRGMLPPWMLLPPWMMYRPPPPEHYLRAMEPEEEMTEDLMDLQGKYSLIISNYLDYG